MASIFGAFGIQDVDKTLDTIGQAVVYEAVTEILMRHNEDLAAVTAVFVEKETTDHTYVYKLPGNGRLQKNSRMGRPGARKAYGGWTVSFDLNSYADQFSSDRVSMAYMSLSDFELNLSSMMIADMNTTRFEILRHLFSNSNENVQDERRGPLTIRRLANTDGTLYFPVIGSETEAEENHYLVSGYLQANISDTNNPFPVVKEELEEHFDRGTPVAFINPDIQPKVEALSDFVPVAKANVQYGDNADLATLPNGVQVPGHFIGKVGDVYVVTWRYIPSRYMLVIDTDQAAPLTRRVDIPTELRGFQLVTEDERHPFRNSFYEHREGYGAGNRLNGVIMEFTTNGSYTTPNIYQ